MSEETKDLEKRLEKLKPLEQKALAAKIVETWPIVKRENSFPAPRCRWLAPRSLCSALLGAIVGAAAAFLGMAFFVPPKVEIREVVREVRIKLPPATDAKAKAETPSENQSFAQLKASDNLDDWLVQSGISIRELDVLIAQSEAVARQMRRDSNSGSASSELVPRRISPHEFRELFRDLKL
jgi:hypothetical protein